MTNLEFLQDPRNKGELARMLMCPYDTLGEELPCGLGATQEECEVCMEKWLDEEHKKEGEEK